jgi:hypothetical protein
MWRLMAGRAMGPRWRSSLENDREGCQVGNRGRDCGDAAGAGHGRRRQIVARAWTPAGGSPASCGARRAHRAAPRLAGPGGLTAQLSVLRGRALKLAELFGVCGEAGRVIAHIRAITGPASGRSANYSARFSPIRATTRAELAHTANSRSLPF